MQNTQELKTIVSVDFSELPCNVVETCTYKERTLSFAVGVQIPVVEVVDPAAVFKECCYIHRVFADSQSSDDYKNDYSGFYYQRQLTNESVTFELVHLDTGDRLALNNSTYGQFYGFGAFPENINFTGYRVDWKKVLSEIGEGRFQIVTNITKIGITTTNMSYVFTLQQYTRERADKTTRIDIVMNGVLKKTSIDFTGLGWKHSLRIGGFFGRRNPQFTEDNIVRRNFENQQISMQQTNEYRFQTNLIPDCISDEIFDFVLMANDIYFNDYNLNNHSYNFIKFGVKFANNEEPIYSNTSRNVQLNMIFNDKFLNNLKRNYK